jgi:hypothetical protein
MSWKKDEEEDDDDDDDDIIFTTANNKFSLLPLDDKELARVRFQRKESLQLVGLLMCSECLARLQMPHLCLS